MSANQRKEFKSIEQQVKYLVETKNLIFSDDIAEVLSERSYTSIINPYKRIFAKGKDNDGHVYDGQITFDKYIELAFLDDCFSYQLFRLISIFERKLKVSLAYTVSNFLANHGDSEGISYVDNLKNYFTEKNNQSLDNIGLIPTDAIYTGRGRQTAQSYLIKTREDFLKEKILDIGTGAEKSKNNLVKYYQINHHKVPFWLLVHDYTLGDLQLLNGLLVKSLKEEVYLTFYMDQSRASAKDLVKFSGQLELLRKIRNIVSHNESMIGFLQNADTNKLEQIFKLIQLLKTTSESSVIAKSGEPDLSRYGKNDYNKKTLEKIEKLLKEIK